LNQERANVLDGFAVFFGNFEWRFAALQLGA
jgi:hypothetical protein